jgi:hypothetical protein
VKVWMMPELKPAQHHLRDPATLRVRKEIAESR